MNMDTFIAVTKSLIPEGYKQVSEGKLQINDRIGVIKEESNISVTVNWTLIVTDNNETIKSYTKCGFFVIRPIQETLATS